MKNTYITKRGEHWNLFHDSPPVPSRAFDWSATHVDYDGEGDHRLVFGETREDVIRNIDEFEEDEIL
jgi:hypothetical protein